MIYKNLAKLVSSKVPEFNPHIPSEDRCIEFFNELSQEDREMVAFLMILCHETYSTDRMLMPTIQ